MKREPKPKADEIELHPDAWERFEKAVDTVMRSPPRHRTAKKKNEPSPTLAPRRSSMECAGDAMRPRKSGSQVTRRWREQDSNPRSLSRHREGEVGRRGPKSGVPRTGDQGFESRSLKRRVICEPDFLDQNTPALLIKISIGPSPSCTADTIACTCFIWATFAWTKIARRSQARTSSATRWDRRVCASGSKFQRHRAADPLLCPRDCVTRTTLPASCMFKFLDPGFRSRLLVRSRRPRRSGA
jgi:hypothetical protein